MRAPLRLGVPLSCSIVVACGGATAPPAAGPDLAIAVAPLDLPGVDNVCYALAVTNEAGELVWQKAHVCASQFGDGPDGDLSYVGTCDATDVPGGGTATNTVTLAIENLYTTAHPWTGDPTVAGDSAWRNPCADDPGTPALEGCALAVECRANADAAVVFNLTVMRQANQGFFDVAVNFADVFCSGKVDCVDALLSDPATGRRGPTEVVAVTCTSGLGGTPTSLYLDAVTVTCADDEAYVVSPLGPGGNTGGLEPGLFQTAVYHGTESLSGVDESYWSVALGLDVETAADPGRLGHGCLLTTRATASEAPFSDVNGALWSPAGTAYPVIDVAVPLTDDAGALLCTAHPLDGGNGVATGYTDLAATAGEAFGYGLDFGADPRAATPPVCGDGLVAASEACDDGNPGGDDGCTACQVDHGFVCAGAPSACASTCGDGVVAADEGCDDGNPGGDDGCDAACQVEPGWVCGGEPSACGVPRVAFVTSTIYQAVQIGSLANADAECQRLADLHPALGGGTFEAWLSDYPATPANRFDLDAPAGFVRPDGQVIATSWADLTDGSLEHPIELTEAGVAIASPDEIRVWTSTNTDGTSPSGFDSCTHWTSNANGTSILGALVSIGSGWTAGASGGLCNDHGPTTARLYCFAQ